MVDPIPFPYGSADYFKEIARRTKEELLSKSVKELSATERALLNIPEPPSAGEVWHLLGKFANHKTTCNCFICRALSDNDKNALYAYWVWNEGRKK